MAGANSGSFKPGRSGNPKGRPRRADAAPASALAARATAPQTTRRDGWINDRSGHGTSRDRRTLTRYGVDIVTDLEALQLWRSEFLAASIIEKRTKAAFRRGWGLKIDGGTGAKKLAEEVCAQAEALHVVSKFILAWQYERAYGGAAIFPVLSGALDGLDKPLDEGAVASVDALHVFEAQELHPDRYYSDIRSPKFNQPETYRLVPLASGRSGYLPTQIIHETRLIIFPGIRVSKQTQPGQREGWGDSCLCRPNAVLADFGLAWGSAATLLHKHGEGTLELEGLQDILGQADGLEEFDKYIAAMEMAQSTLRMMVVPGGGGSKFTRSTGTLGGVAEMLREFKTLMAAAADEPVSILFGDGATGLRTGDEDTRKWYDTVEADRADHAPQFEQLIRFLLLATAGPTSGAEPEVWSVEFPSLHTPSEKETAETRKTDMDRAVAAVNAGIASADDVAESYYGGDTYSGDIKIDWKRRKAQAAIDEERAEDLEEDPDALEAMGRSGEEEDDDEGGDEEDAPDDEDLAELEREDSDDDIAWDVPDDDADLDAALAAARARLAELEARAAGGS